MGIMEMRDGPIAGRDPENNAEAYLEALQLKPKDKIPNNLYTDEQITLVDEDEYGERPFEDKRTPEIPPETPKKPVVTSKNMKLWNGPSSASKPIDFSDYTTNLSSPEELKQTLSSIHDKKTLIEMRDLRGKAIAEVKHLGLNAQESDYERINEIIAQEREAQHLIKERINQIHSKELAEELDQEPDQTEEVPNVTEPVEVLKTEPLLKQPLPEEIVIKSGLSQPVIKPRGILPNKIDVSKLVAESGPAQKKSVFSRFGSFLKKTFWQPM